MSNIVPIRRSGDVDRLWSEYAALAQAVVTDVNLLTDRQHQQALARAERRFRDAYLASESAA